MLNMLKKMNKKFDETNNFSFCIKDNFDNLLYTDFIILLSVITFHNIFLPD